MGTQRQIMKSNNSNKTDVWQKWQKEQILIELYTQLLLLFYVT